MIVKTMLNKKHEKRMFVIPWISRFVIQNETPLKRAYYSLASFRRIAVLKTYRADADGEL